MASQTIVDPYKDAPAFKNQRLKITSSAPFVPSLIQSNLPSSLDAARAYASRLQGKQILLENPVKESRNARIRREKKQRRAQDKAKRDSGVISRTQAKRLGIWKLHKSAARYDLFFPIHLLWVAYVSELLNLLPAPDHPQTTPPPVPNSSAIHPKLVKADFHGSIITVKDAKNQSLIGLSGIVVQETENTFKIVTQKDQFKVIPKQNSIFTFKIPLYAPTLPDDPVAGGDALPPSDPLDHLPCLQFDLYGNQFRFRSADRANRKFKHKATIELL